MQKTFSTREMSKIVDIPIDTLKHYDRIDLFKPAIVKPDSLYRFYTLDQIYTLVLIKDLRALDFSISEIRDYLNDRNVTKSLNLLEKKLAELNKTILTLSNRQKNLQNKIDSIKMHNNMRYELNEIIEKVCQKRTVISFGVCINNTDARYFASRQLEKAIADNSPGIVACTHGAFIPQKELEAGELLGSSIAFAFINSDTPEQYASSSLEIKPGIFVCGYFEGRMWDRDICLGKILEYVKKHELHITGDGILINYIDDNVTDYDKEFLYEIQVPVTRY